ncbi:MAG TPA: MFS transporter [Clostridiales bacterium]|nr:MFS transporter [Clostridiales bacterium]HQP69439.1 MFS transporter [Clostridiales bacterium]
MKRIAEEYIKITKIIRKDAWYFLVGNFFAGFGFTGFSLLFNLYLKESGKNEGTIGHVLSTGTYATVLMIFPAAYIVRKMSIRPIMIIVPVVMSAGYALAIQADSLQMIMAGIALSGFAGAFSSVIGGPLLMQSSGETERTHLFSINHAVALLSGITGNLVAGKLPDFLISKNISFAVGYRYAIFIHLVIALISLYFYGKIRVRHISFSDNGEDEDGVFRFRIKTSKKLLAYLAIPPMMVGLGAGMTIPFLNLYFKTRFEMSSNNIGMLFALAQLFTIGGALIAPMLARRFGKIMSVILSQIFSLPFLFILGMSHYLPLAITAFLIRNALMNMSAPISSNYSMESVHPDDRSITSGLLSLAWLFTWGITANIGGYFIENFGYELPFAFTMIFYILSSYLYYKLLYPLEKEAREKNKQEEIK